MTTPLQLQLTAGILCLAATSVAADEKKSVLDQWMALYRERAQSIEMRLADEPDRRLDLHSSSLLKYTNPVRSTQQHGAVHLWTLDERPAVIASIWSAVDREEPDLRNLAFEWHSLSADNIVAERNGERLWNSGQPGVEWEEFREGAAPARSHRLRLSQMRRMARSLSARIKTGESELRMMPQPLYRYPETARGAIDGALFSFVMGTDPELLVLFEARSRDGGTPAWHIGFARFTSYPLQVKRGDKELWSCELAKTSRGLPLHQRTGRYCMWYKVERLPAALETNRSSRPTGRTSCEP